MKKFVFLAVLFCSLVGCGTQQKIRRVRQGSMNASLSLPVSDSPQELSLAELKRDTLTVQDEDGKELVIMRAVRDENGEMVATDVISAAVVTARFRNVAERHGKVDLRFQVIVPKEMQDSKWQLRFSPLMTIMGETVQMDSIIISGNEYRKAQLRGYEQYDKFLRSIVTDSSKFINMKELEVFLMRNMPFIYSLKTDSSFVSDETFASMYGVTQREAIQHYTSKYKVRANDRRIAMKDKMYNKYVKVPIVSQGLKLDTVLTSSQGDFVYDYVQTINTMPKLKKVEISLSGEIFEEDTKLYSIPGGDPLTFYISSLSSFADQSERYMTKVLERKVEANAVCWIDFETASANVNPDMGNNAIEIGRIKKNLSDLLENKEFDLDSIVVTASCSPEGNYQYNEALSKRRSISVKDYFDRYIKDYRDSLRREAGFEIGLDGKIKRSDNIGSIKMVSRHEAENWSMFATMIDDDTYLTQSAKNDIRQKMETYDPDASERAMSGQDYYIYLRQTIYPRLRTVRFNFYLHRKGMVRDTVHTTVLDTVYMRGVKAIEERDYQTAVSILRPYGDYNAAVALCAMDYNASAMEILARLEPTDKVEYMKAIIHSRRGETQEAVQCYLNACSKNPSFVHRGNLDPEISVLIKAYGLNKE